MYSNCCSSRPCGSGRPLHTGSALASQWHIPGRIFARPVHQRPVRAQAVSGNPNHDDGEDLDYTTSAEFAKFTDPMKMQAVARHLDFMWQVSQRKRPSACDCCNGSGETECTWCHGTGVLTIGEEIYCNTSTGCQACPVCNRKGACKCDHCKGTGKRASWMEPGCPV